METIRFRRQSRYGRKFIDAGYIAGKNVRRMDGVPSPYVQTMRDIRQRIDPSGKDWRQTLSERMDEAQLSERLKRFLRVLAYAWMEQGGSRKDKRHYVMRRLGITDRWYRKNLEECLLAFGEKVGKAKIVQQFQDE